MSMLIVVPRDVHITLVIRREKASGKKPVLSTNCDDYSLPLKARKDNDDEPVLS